MVNEYEVSFEKDIWFSKAIKVHRGYNLLDTYNPTDEFEKNFKRVKKRYVSLSDDFENFKV